MMRVHIVGLPRSGTTALSQAVAQTLDLPLVVEPIFLWTDGFRIDLTGDAMPDAHKLERIRSRIAKLDRVYGTRGGYVEKTPSSVFLAPVLKEILRDTFIIVVTRDRAAIEKSLSRMIFESLDGNLRPSESFFAKQLKVRLAKVLFMLRALGPIFAFPAIARFLLSGRRQSIASFSNRQEIEKFVDGAMSRLDNLDVGDANRVLILPYDQFRDAPERTMTEILAFFRRAPESKKGNTDAP